MRKRAVLYARVSGDDRGKDGRNLAGQLEMCRQYAQSHGYSVVAELAEDDSGASGASFELPQLNKVREFAQSHKFDVLVLREIDRLSRSLAKQLIVEDELKRYGATIEYVLGEYPDTPEGSLMKHVKASIAEYERMKIIERSARGRYLRVKSGSVYVSGHPPYGYELTKSDDGKKLLLAVKEGEATVVRLIFNLYTIGSGQQPPMAIRAIARELDKRNIMTPSSPVYRKLKRGWVPTTVRNILASETYVGVWTYGKTHQGKYRPPENPVHVNVPPIIDSDLWAVAQSRLKDNSRHATRHVRHEYLMRQRLRCGECDQILHSEAQHYHSSKKSAVYKYYVCNDDITGTKKCEGHRCNATVADAVVWEWLKLLAEDVESLKQGIALFQAQSEHDSLQIRKRLTVADDLLTRHQAQLARLVDLYVSGEIDKELLIERKSRLEHTIASLEHERTGINEQLEALTMTPEKAKTIESFSEAVRRRLPFGDKSFAARQQTVEVLNVTGRLVKENGQMWIEARCILGEKLLQLTTNGTCGSCSRRSPHQASPCRGGFVRPRARRR